MPDITPETSFSPITIQGLSFDSPESYTEGHTLTANEAAVMNQTLAENLRNNFASTVKEEQEAAEKENRPVDKAKLDAAFKAYYMEYEFGVRRGGSRGLDPLQAAIRDIGREAVRKALRKQGVKLADVSVREIDELVEAAVQKPENKWIVDLAQKRVKEDQELSSLSVNI